MSKTVRQELAELRKAFDDLRKQYEPGGFTKEEQDDLDALSKRIADFQHVVDVGLAGDYAAATKGSPVAPSAPTEKSAVRQAQGGTATAPVLANQPGGGGNGSGGPGGRGGGSGGPGDSDKSKKDMGYAKTDPGPPPPKDMGHAKTEPEPPQPPPHGGSGAGTTALPPSRGDGQPVEIKQAFDVMRKNGEMIRSSGSHSYHRKIWQEYLGKTGDPPVAFKFSGRIQIDVDKLEASQHQQWLELDKAKNPGRYVKDKEPEKPATQTPPAKGGGSGTVGTAASEPSPQQKPKGRPWHAEVQEVSPQLALQRSTRGVHVHASVSAKSHQQVWSMIHGKTGKAPVAFMVDKAIYVDMRRWPKDIPPPNIVTAGGGEDPRFPKDAYNKASHAQAPSRTSTAPPTQQGAQPSTDDPRAAASKLRGQIDAQRKESAERLLRIQKLEPVLKAKVDAATGDEKKALAEKQVLLAKEIGAAERAVARAKADLDAIDNPGTKREELLAILARQKTGGKVTESTEITATGLDPYKKGKVNTDVTTTTTSYAGGKATTESVRSQQKVGLDGYTKSESHDKTVTDGHTTARSSSEKKVNVSLGGKLSKDEKQAIEVQKADGSKAALEVTKNKEISAKGASQTRTATVTKVDGSSVSKSTKQGVERGDGQVIGTTSSSVTKTNASGTARTTDKSVSGGLVAGDGGFGAKGGVDGGKSITSKKGRHAGIVAGLHANVSCKIGEPKGEPKLYPVTVTVSFVASGGVSAGGGKKEGSKVSGSVEIKGSLEREMVVTHHYGEAELAGYIKNLEAASKKGSKVAATQNEIAIISTGVNEGWDAARKMWKPNGDKIGKETADGLVKSGDSAQVSEKKTGGIAAKGKIGPVGGGYGVTDTNTSSMKVTRNDTGGLDVDKRQEHGRQTDVSGSLDVGVVGLEVGKTHVHKTRFGYSIAIDPKNDPDGKILEHLSYCKTEQDYIIFLGVHKGKVTLIGKMEGQTDADSTNIGVSIGGKSLKLGTNQGVDKETTTDATGKVVGKKTTGSAGAGGELGSFADSKSDEAVAETDAEGNASLTLTSTEKKNYGSRVREKKDKKALEKLTGTGKASGVLTDAAGGEEDDTAVQDVSGLKLANKDLRRLGQSAVNSWEWWMDQWRRADEKKDWEKAGIAIRKAKGSPSAVGHALAEFIGGDRIKRLEMVERLFRGGYHQTAGKAFEFPDSLRDIRAEYDLVTDDGLPDKMNTLANKQGDPAAVKECLRLLAIVDRIQPRVQACHDFNNNATKTEMLSELEKCRTMLNRGVKGYGGNLKPEDDPKVLAEEGDKLLKLCYAYGGEQAILVGKLDNQDAITVSERSDGKKLIKQLEALQDRWWNEYHRLQDNYAKRKLVVPDPPYAFLVPQIKPNEALVAEYEKKFVR